MKKIFISAGEPSGDIHAARLMKSLRAKCPDVTFIGLGGENMIREGLEAIVSMDEISVVGFSEVARRYRFFKDLLNKCKNILSQKDVDMFLPVDYPGFNIKLAQHSKSIDLPVVYYIAPQLWAWGKKRAKKLQGIVDLLIVVFPFELEYFNNFGINAKCFGHPLLDNPRIADYEFNSQRRENTIALIAGSRKQEIERHLPLFYAFIDLYKDRFPDFQFVFAKPQGIDKSVFEPYLKENILLSDNSIDLMIKSKAGIVKTGTSNLEAALCGMPFVMMYKASALTYLIGKSLVNLKYISLVNILLNKSVVTELIQGDANPKAMVDEISKLITNDNTNDKNDMINEFMKIKDMLGTPGCSDRIANEILLNYLK